MKHIPKIPAKDITVSKISLGSGGYGVVKQGFMKSKKLDVAIKKFKKGANSFLSRCQGDGVIKLYDVLESTTNIVMELANGRNLKNALYSSSANLDDAHLVRLAADVSRTMERLHSIGIVHRDLKSENLVLNHEMTVIKVCDFEAAREVPKKMKPNVGTIEYMAPEVETENHNSRADVGKILWEIIKKEIPRTSSAEITYDNIDKAAAEVIKTCITGNADERVEFN